mgnify:CR=1 FL=1
MIPTKCDRPVCPRCNHRIWLDPKPYKVGGPELRRCRTCGFSLDVRPMVEVPGRPITMRVVLGKDGSLTRVRYDGNNGPNSGQYGSVERM